jgi:hypothetical protein
MRKTALALGLALLAATAPATAAICTIDNVPAATLLLPYFEVDLNNPNGLTTLFSVNNARARSALVHVVIWSDLSVPVLAFDVYLTGYDVQSVNLRDIIVNGNLPQTAPLSEDPSDTISPKGPFSHDDDYPNCQGVLPPPQLPAIFTSSLQAALTGKSAPILGNLCAGRSIGDNIARGYVTMDTVNACSSYLPGDPGYFGGTVTDKNLLWGDWFIVNTVQNFAEGGTLVHVEADATNPSTTTPGDYTFYGRYDGWAATDHREPLATTFGTRFLNGGAFSGGTSLLVWRDTKTNQHPFSCSTSPAWFPLADEGMVIFDEQEHAYVPPPGSFPFPAATQRTQVNGASLPVPWNFGWLYLDLNSGPGSNPPADTAAAQAWVVSTLASNGHFAVGIDGIQFDSACAANHSIP